MSDPHPSSTEPAFLGATALRGSLEAGAVSSREVVSHLLERIAATDRVGPQLRSVISLDDEAVELAGRLDRERRAGRVRGPLHGIPVLVKDNIDTAGSIGTTAGSYALAGAPPAEDAPLVAQLRRAGAIVLGKANLSEWSHFRGRAAPSGWSAVGGQCRNPHALDRSPGGSSAGSGAAVAAGLAPLAVGTETDGSILCPSAACGIVGLKPTVGLVSRSGIVPISSSQDTAGPMARSVADAALLLEVLASGGVDPADSATAMRPIGLGGYREAVDRSAAGMRVGIATGAGYSGYHPPTDAATELAYEALRRAGVDVVPEVACEKADEDDELVVLCTELRATLGAYLAGRRAATGQGPASLDDLVAFNRANPSERLDVFTQDLFERSASAPGLDDTDYLAARRRNWDRTRRDGIDGVCDRHGLQALMAPTMGPAWPIDHVAGEAYSGGAWGQAAVAGYPSITVPVGLVQDVPVGVALWGPAWSETTLLTVAAALERELATGSPRPLWKESSTIVA